MKLFSLSGLSPCLAGSLSKVHRAFVSRRGFKNSSTPTSANKLRKELELIIVIIFTILLLVKMAGRGQEGTVG